MIEVNIAIDIACEPAAAFDVLSNFEKNPTWQLGMKKCVFTTDPPLAVGSRYDQLAGFMGKEIKSTFEVVEYEPGKRVKATTIEGSFPITFTRWVEPNGDHTRVRALIEGDSTGFFRLAEPLMKLMVRRSIRKDYARLKQLLESQ